MILADGNLLIAFSWDEHEDHDRAVRFFEENPKVATCPITELNLVRVTMQLGATGEEADKRLQNFIEKRRGKLIPDDISATDISGLNTGHRQTTDSYLAMLAKKNGLTVATLDEPFAKKFPGLVELIADNAGKKQ